MDIVSAVSAAARRELNEEESTILRRLSAQGLAKVNEDLCRGANIEMTLAELSLAFRKSRRLQAMAKHSACPHMQAVLARLGRPPTTVEALALLESPLFPKLAPSLLPKAPEEISDALDELAYAHLKRIMLDEGEKLGQCDRSAVSLSWLSPTWIPPLSEWVL
eukprot:RCo049802